MGLGSVGSWSNLVGLAPPRKRGFRTGTQHSGLGLSLAAELASTLGGSLTAVKPADGELVFTLRLRSVPGEPG